MVKQLCGDYMDEFNEKKRILLKHKNHILRMPNNKKKVVMLNAYFSLFSFHQFIMGVEDIGEINIDEEFTRKFNRYILNDSQKKIDETSKNAPILYNKLEEIIKEYKENEFFKYAYVGYAKVNKERMEQAIWDFFTFLGDDVLKIYCKMITGDNIFLNNVVMNRLGYAMDATPLDNPCIAIQNVPNYLDFYITLAHEIGHCYQFYLQKTQRNCAAFDPYCEITSMLFEKLFIEYLKKHNLIKDVKKLNLENHLCLLSNISIAKVMCKLLMNDEIGLVNPYDLSYTCSVPKEDLVKEIIADSGYVKPFNLKPELTEIHYAFGYIIANHFVEKLKNDFANEWTNFKNFICTMEYLPMQEVIDTYFDVDLVKEDIKKLTKSYRER